jgi:sigma-B regulation protein RsbU (phosphoserine phosphatase)
LSARSRELLDIDRGATVSIQRLLAALHPGDREAWKNAIAQVLDAEQGGECRFEFRTVGAPERWLVASGRAFFEGIRAVRVVGTLQDITDQKRSEEERDIRLGELGHDLRVPLSAISMGVQLVQRDVPEKAMILSAMRLTLQRMNRLIDQLLRFARSGTGELVLQREWVPLAEICQEAIDEASVAHPGHPIEFECWDDAPGQWDRDRLVQVVRNLLSNALTHGAAGEPVIVSVIDRGEEALLAVANRGQPIPELFREHLLDPTRRGPWSRDHLGLAIVKEIVRAHGGRIELTSDEIATIFHIWLPKTRESSLPQHETRTKMSRFASRRAGVVAELSEGEAQ